MASHVASRGLIIIAKIRVSNGMKSLHLDIGRKTDRYDVGKTGLYEMKGREGWVVKHLFSSL